MKNRMWINLLMVILVAGLFFTVSCAKKTVVSDATISGSQTNGGSGSGGGGAMTEAEIAQQKADEAKARTFAAEKRFQNQDVHFEYDSSDLSSMAKTLLKEKATWLRANSAASAVIEGHCDDRGTIEYNLALGERRASAAKAYLVNLGISGARLKTVSYGEEQPIDSGRTETAFRNNRRVHFEIK